MQYEVNVSVKVEADSPEKAKHAVRFDLAQLGNLYEVDSVKPINPSRQRLGDLKPGTIFVCNNHMTFGTHICMKLVDQKVVNLDAHALYKHVNQDDMVEVLWDKKISLTNK